MSEKDNQIERFVNQLADLAVNSNDPGLLREGIESIVRGFLPAAPAKSNLEPVASPTAGMKLGERIAHVGGRTNAQGYVEFGSEMAVHALIQHVLRDLKSPPAQQPETAAGEPLVGDWVKVGPIVFSPGVKIQTVINAAQRQYQYWNENKGRASKPTPMLQKLVEAARQPSVTKCNNCGQSDNGQTGEYPCPVCGLPTAHDEQPAQPSDTEKDAARYRWLRNDSINKSFGDGVKAPVVFNVDDSFNHDSDDHLEDEELDKAVDKAMQEDQEGS